MRQSVFVLLALLTAALVGAQSADLAEVRGNVTGPDGTPQVGVLVSLTAAADPAARFETTTDPAGAFALDVPDAEGTYLLSMTKEGLSPLEAELELATGEWYEYNIRMGSADTSKRNQAIAAYNEGVQAWEAENTDAAIEAVREAIELDPTLPQAHLTLAHITVGTGDIATATTAMDQYLTLEKGDATAARLAYRIYRSAGQGAKARQALADVKGTEQAPPLAAEIYNQGVKSFQEGDDSAAVIDFRTATELQPDLAEAWGALATAHYNLEEYDFGLAAADRLLALDPQNARGLRIRYLILDASGDTGGAAQAMAAYREADPGAAVELLVRRARADYEDGLAAKAKTALLQALATQPDHPDANYQMGLVYAGEGDLAKAKEHLGRFLELAPDHPDAPVAQEMIDAL